MLLASVLRQLDGKDRSTEWLAGENDDELGMDSDYDSDSSVEGTLNILWKIELNIIHVQ